MNRAETIAAIKSADLSETDWEQAILDLVADKYARGYLTAKVSQLWNSIGTSSEEFREEFLQLCNHDIWDK